MSYIYGMQLLIDPYDRLISNHHLMLEKMLLDNH